MRISLPSYSLPLLVTAALVAGCNDHKFTAPVKLGGQEVSAEVLNRGYEGYMQYCRPCHGDNGDGKGFSSYGLRPPPRDFTQGLFKFGGVSAPALPPDSELVRIVRGGLHGTAMLPWELPDGELLPVLQYIKTLAPHKWATEEPGKPIERSPDPYGPAKRAEAIAFGEKLYHAKAQCSGCHPSFVTHEKLFEITRELSGTGQTDFSEEMYLSQLKESEYCLEWKPGWTKLDERECVKPVKILPPNFTKDDIRAGTSYEDLYRTIASGIGGANMPTWKGALKEEEIWAMVYYVKSLIELKGTPAVRALYAKLEAPANMSWKPAAEGAAPEAPPADGKAAPAAKPAAAPAAAPAAKPAPVKAAAPAAPAE